MRVMGLDFGSKTVGVAISDALMVTAQGIEEIAREAPSDACKDRRAIRRISGRQDCAWISKEYGQYRRGTV